MNKRITNILLHTPIWQWLHIVIANPTKALLISISSKQKKKDFMVRKFMITSMIVVNKQSLIRYHEIRSEEHTSELQSRFDLVCRLLLEKKKKKQTKYTIINI